MGVIPPGPWGPKEFAGMTDEELHQVKMGCQPGSNDWEFATAEQQERQRKALAGQATPINVSHSTLAASKEETERWDFFISHASEDKEVIAGPLADTLKGKGLAVWYDDFSLTVGDSLRESITRATGSRIQSSRWVSPVVAWSVARSCSSACCTC